MSGGWRPHRVSRKPELALAALVLIVLLVGYLIWRPGYDAAWREYRQIQQNGGKPGSSR